MSLRAPPHVALVPKGRRSEVGKFAVSKLLTLRLVSVCRWRLVAGILGRVFQWPGAEEVEIKAGLSLLPSVHTHAHSQTWLALGVEEAGWHPPLGKSISLKDPVLFFSWVWRMQEGPATSWERVGTSLLGIPVGLTITCRSKVGASWPGRGNVR